MQDESDIHVRVLKSPVKRGVAPLAAQRNVDFLEKYMGIEMKQLVLYGAGIL